MDRRMTLHYMQPKPGLPRNVQFNDVVEVGPYRSSETARDATVSLARAFKLQYTHNPGGGEFYKDGFRCQIHQFDEVADYWKLFNALSEGL